jgi:putative ABC transport system permease protein
MLPVQDVSMSGSVFLYAAVATCLAALIFGIAPTVWTVRRVPADVLRDEGRTASGSVRVRRWGEGLLVAQVALALALTLGAGLLVRSYLLLQRVEPGFDPTNVLAVSINLPGIRYDSLAKVLGFYERLERETRVLPGVDAAAAVSGVPLGPPMWSSEFAVSGRPPMARGGEVLHREITPEYQKVMRVRLARGRVLTGADRQDAPPVVLINETLARMYFAGEDPVGQRVTYDREPDSSSTWRTIVGVVGDERQRELGEPARPEFLAPYPQEPRNAMTMVVRTSGDPMALAPAVRGIVTRMDPLLAISAIRSMEEVRSASLARDLRGDGAAGPAPHPGDGDPAGPGRQRGAAPVAGRPKGSRPHRPGHRGGNRDGPGRHPADSHAALPDRAGRSGDLCHGGPAGTDHGGTGVMAACGAGQPGRSGGGAEKRLKRET